MRIVVCLLAGVAFISGGVPAYAQDVFHIDLTTSLLDAETHFPCERDFGDVLASAATLDDGLPNLAEANRRIDAAAKQSSEALDLGGLNLRDVPAKVFWLAGLKRLKSRVKQAHGPVGRDRPARAVAKAAARRQPDRRASRRARPIALPCRPQYRLEQSAGPTRPDRRRACGAHRAARLQQSDRGPAGRARRAPGVENAAPQFNPLTGAAVDKLGALRALEELKLTGTGLTALPPSFTNLTALKSLELSSNRFAAVPPQVLCAQISGKTRPGAHRVDGAARRDRRAQAPRRARSRRERADRSAGGTRRAHLAANAEVWRGTSSRRAAVIGRLASLRVLSLVGNPLTELDAGIGNLAALEGLLLTSTGLKKFPDGIGNLRKLKVLAAQSAPLEQLPASMGNLKPWKASVSARPCSRRCRRKSAV